MNQPGIPVLMYHALEDAQHPAGAKDQGEQLYILSTDKFREQMQYLHTNGFKTYLLSELNKLDNWPQKAIVLTFDDGHASNYTLALPILQEFGFKAEFFITTGWIGTKHFLTPEQIVKLNEAGMGIGSHSVTHAYFNDLKESDILHELHESKTTLEIITESNVLNFSAPGGRLKSSRMTYLAMKANYLTFATSAPNVFKKSASFFEIPRFALRDDINIGEFIQIVNKSFLFLLKIKATNLLLFLAKTVLGNNKYNIVRSKLLRQAKS